MTLLVVHPHFHFRRTGVTGHVEAIVPALAAGTDARVMGRTLMERLPRITVWELLRRARTGPVVWHAHRNNELLVGLLLRVLRPKLKVVVTRHSATAPGAYTRFLLARADSIISLTRQVAAQVGQTRDVIGHGVDLERFRPPDGGRDAAWKALGVGGALGIGVVGRIRPEKGQGDFATALGPLWSKYPAWSGLLLGRVQARDLNWSRALFSERLTHLEERGDPLGVYQGLTVLVQPSHSEGYSLVLLEALASGCCVVASRLPHFPELVEEGQTGFLYPPGDVEALRIILDRLMAHPKEAQEVGARAALAARARLGIEHEARALLAVYGRLG